MHYPRGATTSADGLGFGLWQIHLGWLWLYQTWGKLLAAAHSSHPCRPTTKPLPHKPNTLIWKKFMETIKTCTSMRHLIFFQCLENKLFCNRMKIALSHIICFWEIHVWVYLAFQVLCTFKEIYYDVDSELDHLYHLWSGQFYYRWFWNKAEEMMNPVQPSPLSYFCSIYFRIFDDIKETTCEFMFLASLTTMTLNIFSVFESYLQNKTL